MEAYINYITTIATDGARPCGRCMASCRSRSLEERIAPDLTGFLGHGPVRVGNQAAKQMQHDVYGSVVLAATQMFVDERLPKMGDEALFRLLETLGERALTHRARARRRHLGISRPRARPHLFGDAVLGGLRSARPDRRRLGIADRAKYWAASARALRERILREAWDEKRGALAGAFGEPELDASVLLRRRTRPVCRRATRASSAPARRSGANSMRNGRDHALHRAGRFRRAGNRVSRLQFLVHGRAAQIGRAEEAREMFESILASRNAFGLLSEDIHPETGELWGNIPQTYSMAGIINTATRLS